MWAEGLSVRVAFGWVGTSGPKVRGGGIIFRRGLTLFTGEGICIGIIFFIYGIPITYCLGWGSVVQLKTDQQRDMRGCTRGLRGGDWVIFDEEFPCFNPAELVVLAKNMVLLKKKGRKYTKVRSPSCIIAINDITRSNLISCYIILRHITSHQFSADPGGGVRRWGQETWNPCSRLWCLSFSWQIYKAPGGGGLLRPTSMSIRWTSYWYLTNFIVIFSSKSLLQCQNAGEWEFMWCKFWRPH